MKRKNNENFGFQLSRAKLILGGNHVMKMKNILDVSACDEIPPKVKLEIEDNIL